ncbi:uncharacterized protein LOC134813691 [Bolinopsis microptera]|uniref:uncharacterized protein LOC134813691 n=1 Tax=Bolinopsis microptera TaxID=2820187 RepID=UPI0030795590
MADMLRIFGWLMAGGGALAHLIIICLGFSTDWGLIMILIAMLSGGLCWIIRSVELLNNYGTINISLFSDKRQLVAIVIMLTGGGGFLFGVCGLARYIQLVELVITLSGGDMGWLNSAFGGQFICAIIGVAATGINSLIAIVQMKKSGQVE